MTPDFAKAVDPIFKMMIDLKEQVEKNSAPAPDAMNDAFIRRIDESQKMLHTRPDDWDLARYALVAWIDEQLASSLSWPGSGFWNQNKLQVKYYRKMLAREAFFEKAIEAEKLPKKDALEVYFLCVVLGFQGVYDGAPGLKTPEDLGQPDKIDDWLRKARNWIKLNPAKVSEKRSAGLAHYADPLNGKYQLLGMVMACIFTGIVASLVMYVSFLGHQANHATGSYRMPLPLNAQV